MIKYDEVREIAYENVLNATKKQADILGHSKKLDNSDYELSEYVLDIILDNPNIVFCVAHYAIENILYEIDGVKTKIGVSVETKTFTMKEFVKYIKSINKRTLFGLFELFSYTANNIEIRFYQKTVPERFNSIKNPI